VRFGDVALMESRATEQPLTKEGMMKKTTWKEGETVAKSNAGIVITDTILGGLFFRVDYADGTWEPFQCVAEALNAIGV